MDLKSFFIFKTYIHISIIIIIFTTLVDETLSADPKFEACVPRNWGRGPKISYPFWIPDEQESYCGYPNFEITCNDKNPVLTISDDDYIIRNIFYTNHSFLVANAAIYDDDTCPIPLHNVSLDRTPFNYSPDRADLFFLYYCPSLPIDFFTFPVGCASNATHHSFASFHKEALEYMNYSIESCQSSVNAPVDVDADFASLLRMNYTEILEMGFLLNWTTHNCSNCERSGGRCGFDNNEFICFCHDGPHLTSCDGNRLNWKLKILIGSKIDMRKLSIASLPYLPPSLVTATAAAGIGILFTCIAIVYCTRSKFSSRKSVFFWRKRPKNDQNVEAFIRNHGSLAPKRYSYSDVKKMTNSFKDKLGQGGFGGVYKGKPHDGRLVAVKVLSTSKGNGEEFINEVASFSRTSHVNIVTFLGFCFEGSKRALIYEFMPNRSLEKFIYNENPLTSSRLLGWEKLYEIAIGIARGLEYLHCGCNTRILHFDIKPHNILLDEDFCPKISDFGLAKLRPRKESIISMLEARGTIGYIAPEVFSRNFGGVSHKSDVYSYGMMVLEMVGGRKNIDVRVGHTSQIYFPHWVYKRLELNNDLGLVGVMNEEDNEIVRKMIIVGIWCIQTDPLHRPSMDKVMDMFEGSIEALQIPPKPFLSSPPRSPAHADSSTTSMS